MKKQTFVGSHRTNPYRPQVFNPAYGVVITGDRRFPIGTPSSWRVEFSGKIRGETRDFPTHAEAITYADKLAREGAK